MFGGFCGGMASDYIFKSRRPPIIFIAFILYTGFICVIYFTKYYQLIIVGIGLIMILFNFIS
jgi:sugar phosphate permease